MIVYMQCLQHRVLQTLRRIHVEIRVLKDIWLSIFSTYIILWSVTHTHTHPTYIQHMWWSTYNI